MSFIESSSYESRFALYPDPQGPDDYWYSPLNDEYRYFAIGGGSASVLNAFFEERQDGVAPSLVSATLSLDLSSVVAYDFNSTPDRTPAGSEGEIRGSDTRLLADPATVAVVTVNGQVVSRSLVGTNDWGRNFVYGDAAFSATGIDVTAGFDTVVFGDGFSVDLESDSFMPGDYDDTLEVTADDIDLLRARSQSSPTVVDMFDPFDLNVDEQITFDSSSASDASVVIRDVLDTEFGDANLDGIVNILDFGILQANFNSTGGWAGGNFNGDNIVNILDFAILQQYFGFSRTGGPASSASAGLLTIPEPQSLGLLLFSCIMLRRRK